VREVLDVVLRVGRDGVACQVEPRRPVRIEEVHADREELKDLAGVVFVRRDVRRRRRGVVVDHVEVAAHRRVQGQVVEDLPIVLEGVVQEHVQVRRHLAGLRDLEPRNNEDLVEREGDALTELVVFLEGVAEEPHLERVQGVVVADAGGRAPGRAAGGGARRHRRQRRIGGLFRGELPVEPGLHSETLDLLNESGRRPERRLFEEPDHVARGLDRVGLKARGGRPERRRGLGGTRERDQRPGQREGREAVSIAAVSGTGRTTARGARRFSIHPRTSRFPVLSLRTHILRDGTTARRRVVTGVTRGVGRSWRSPPVSSFRRARRPSATTTPESGRQRDPFVGGGSVRETKVRDARVLPPSTRSSTSAAKMTDGLIDSRCRASVVRPVAGEPRDDRRSAARDEGPAGEEGAAREEAVVRKACPELLILAVSFPRHGGFR
jgi:hypothetical protein